MIIIDHTEARKGTALPKMEGVVISPVLEQVTGADIMISTLTMPATTETLIGKHIESGALLIQRKTGLDLINSLGDRLNESLARMQTTCAFQSQAVLLFVGLLQSSPAGFAIVDSSLTETPYMNVVGAFDTWNDRGGVVSILERSDLIEGWLKMREKKLFAYQKQPVKWVYPIENAFKNYQTLLKVDDWRITLATFPQIGAARVNLLRDKIIENNEPDSLITALLWITNSKLMKNTKGFGKVLIENSRNWLGLPENYNLVLMHEDEVDDYYNAHPAFDKARKLGE